MPITMKSAKAEMRAIGISLRYLVDTGEYRVNYAGGAEATAYYTNCIEDAVATGHMMAARKEGHSR